MFKNWNHFLLEGEPSALAGGATPPVDTPPVDTPPVDTPPADITPPSSIWDGIDVKFPEGFDEGLRAEPSLKPFVNKETGEFNMANVLKSYIHTKKQFGENKITLPSENSPQEEIDQFWQKLGWTNDENEYGVAKPEESVLDDEFVNGFKKFAIENRLPKAAAQKMVEFLDGQAKTGLTKSQEMEANTIKSGLESLQTEWGQAYAPKLGVAQKVLKEVVKDEAVLEMFKDPKVGSNPAVIKALAAIGEKLYKEDGFAGGSGSGAPTPEEAMRQINDIMGDSNHPFNKPDHPSHKQAVQDVLKLHELKRGR